MRQRFQELFLHVEERVRRRVRREMGRHVRGAVDVEDVFQEAVARAWSVVNPQLMKQWEQGQRFERVLVWIAVRRIRDLGRLQASRPVSVALPYEFECAARESEPETEVGGAEFEERLRTALAKVSGADREILVLRGLDGLSYDDIAVHLNCKPGNARLRLFRARRKLAGVLRLVTCRETGDSADRAG